MTIIIPLGLILVLKITSVLIVLGLAVLGLYFLYLVKYKWP